MNSEKRSYLKGLVYDLLPKERIFAGFIKYYILEGQSLVVGYCSDCLASGSRRSGKASSKRAGDICGGKKLNRSPGPERSHDICGNVG